MFKTNKKDIRTLSMHEDQDLKPWSTLPYRVGDTNAVT